MRLAARREVLERVRRLSAARLSPEPLLAEIAELCARVLPYDCASLHTVDPTTVTITSCLALNGPPDGQRIAEIEYTGDDVNRLADLIGVPGHRALLSAATGGRPERSARYRDLLAPAGLTDELRAVTVVDGACWGSLAWYRAGAFREDELSFVEDLLPLVARALRMSASVGTAEGALGWPPGVVLVDPSCRMCWISGTARPWLAEVGCRGEPLDAPLPDSLRSVAQHARAVAGAAAQVIGVSGRWVQVHASASEREPEHVALVLQDPTPAAVAPLLAAAFGLTERERQLTDLVLRGLGTNQIAGRLFISPHTVQDHLKSIFAKVGVHSRRELFGRMRPNYDSDHAGS